MALKVKAVEKKIKFAKKDELVDTAIQITCYDCNGNIVKRITSADSYLGLFPMVAMIQKNNVISC